MNGPSPKPAGALSSGAGTPASSWAAQAAAQGPPHLGLITLSARPAMRAAAAGAPVLHVMQASSRLRRAGNDPLCGSGCGSGRGSGNGRTVRDISDSGSHPRSLIPHMRIVLKIDPPPDNVFWSLGASRPLSNQEGCTLGACQAVGSLLVLFGVPHPQAPSLRSSTAPPRISMVRTGRACETLLKRVFPLSHVPRGLRDVSSLTAPRTGK